MKWHRLYDVIRVLWCDMGYMMRYRLHDVIRVMWCDSGYVMRYRLHDVIRVRRCDSGYMTRWRDVCHNWMPVWCGMRQNMWWGNVERLNDFPSLILTCKHATSSHLVTTTRWLLGCRTRSTTSSSSATTTTTSCSTRVSTMCRLGGYGLGFLDFSISYPGGNKTPALYRIMFILIEQWMLCLQQNECIFPSIS